ncbi:MAG: hypothetical protein RR614_04775, partial [Eubacterium sp.]
GINRNTPSILRVMVTDNAGNVTTRELSYKLDSTAPAISVTTDPAGGKYAPSYKLTLTNTNMAAVDRSAYKNGENISGLTYYYSTDQTNWTKINEQPAYGDVTTVYSNNTLGTLYIKAENEAGVATANTEVTIKIDQVAPKNGSIAIMANEKDEPDGQNGYYKTMPQITMTPQNGKDIDGIERSPVTMWYRLDKGSAKGEETPMGAAIRDSKYYKGKADQPAIGNNLNTGDGDKPKELGTNESVTAVDTSTAGADSPGATSQSIASVTQATGGVGNITSDSTDPSVRAPGRVTVSPGIENNLPSDVKESINKSLSVDIDVIPEDQWVEVGNETEFLAAFKNYSSDKTFIRLTNSISIDANSEIYSPSFHGIIDGCGYTITGGKGKKLAAGEPMALFGNYSKLAIYNLTFKEVQTHAIAGFTFGLVLYNVHREKGSQSISSTSAENGLGGFVTNTVVSGDSFRMINCTSNVPLEVNNVKNFTSGVGGLIGILSFQGSNDGAAVENCVYTGSINITGMANTGYG